MNIKFKVWDSEEKCFVDKRDGLFVVNREGELCTSTRLGVYPAIKRYASVFSTGQTDKNGVEIYEGDIVTPEFSKLNFVLEAKPWGTTLKSIEDGGYYPTFSFLTMFIKNNRTRLIIIGNKYENPELLETK